MRADSVCPDHAESRLVLNSVKRELMSALEYSGVQTDTLTASTSAMRAESLARPAQWYAVYTKSRHEKVVHRCLQSKGIDSFLPLCQVLSRWKDRRVWVEKPLFPGYLFVDLPRENLGPVKAARGVVHVLGNDEGPIQVPEEQVEAVRRMVERHVPLDPWPYMEQGKRVRVMSGPLIGMEGFIVERKKKCRLVVSVDLLGRSVATEIEAQSVELI
jgi:transcription antitermination factor NusG